MILLEECGSSIGIAGFLFLCWHFLTKEKRFIICFAAHFAAMYNGIEKLYWKEPRPYFLVDSVPLSCKDHEYGFPSGHA